MKQIAFSRRWPEFAAGALILIGLVLTSLYHYLLFHSLVEFFSIAVAAGIFMVTWNSRRFIENGYLLLIGIALLFVGGIDLVHTLAYQGMGVFAVAGANLATQLWIAGRYLDAVTLLIAPLFVRRKLNAYGLVAVYFMTTAVLVASIFAGIFPACYIDGVGLTLFKIASEYLIAGMEGAGLLLLVSARRAFEPGVYRLLAISLVADIVSELAFTSYVNVYDGANLIGHIFKLVAFYLVYKAIIQIGLVTPFALVFKDLTDREQALKNVNAELAREIAERRKAEAEISHLNQSLEKHAADLEMANKELEAFAYSVSHDLRAPLRSMMGFSTILLREHADQLSASGQRFLQLVHDNAEDTERLVNGLLSFSRTGRQALNKQPVATAEVVRQVLADLSAEQEGRRIEMTIGDLPVCNADPLLLKQVWVNLLSNALKFTRKCEVAKIEIGYECQDGRQVYFIRDNGAGFDSRQAENLFGVFRRFHHQEDYEGTGVGLAIVARIVHRHGGEIWAHAEVDRGATFCFTI